MTFLFYFISIIISKFTLLYSFHHQLLQPCICGFDPYLQLFLSHMFLENFHQSESPTQSDRLFIPTKPTGLSLSELMGFTRADKPWFEVTGASHRDCRSSAYCNIAHLFMCCSLLPVPEGVCRSFFLLQQGKHTIASILLIQYKTYKLMPNILRVRK